MVRRNQKSEFMPAVAAGGCTEWSRSPVFSRTGSRERPHIQAPCEEALGAPGWSPLVLTRASVTLPGASLWLTLHGACMRPLP